MNGRYARQIAMPYVGEAGQKRLGEGTAAVVGCGALGSACAGYLARAGVGRIVLIDPDRVELSNLQRQSLYSMSDLGGLKAEAAARALAAVNPEIELLPVARRLEAEAGPGGRSALTAGGRLLCMALAVDNVCTSLRVYARARRSPEMQLELLGALDELTAAEIGPARLMEAAERAPGVLGDKLRDLALLSEAFAAAVGSERLDPGGSLDLAAERLERSDFARGGVVYIDGFTDFTAQEKRIIELLLGRADVTVCLTLDDVGGGSELFDLARSTARWLMRRARVEGMACRVETAGAGERSPMDVLSLRPFDRNSALRRYCEKFHCFIH